MKEMCRVIPIHACLNCGNCDFVVVEYSSSMYDIDKYGSICQTADLDYEAVGMCKKCGTTYKMIPTSDGFIPYTPLRALLFDYCPVNIPETMYPEIPNPMEAPK